MTMKDQEYADQLIAVIEKHYPAISRAKAQGNRAEYETLALDLLIAIDRAIHTNSKRED